MNTKRFSGIGILACLFALLLALPALAAEAGDAYRSFPGFW